MNPISHKLTFKEKCGYGSAAIGDAICYTLPGTYMMFFLTTVAGIEPVTAGTITAVAAVWDAIWNPTVGYLSDHHRSRMGRRRPFLLGFVFPLVISTILLFTNMDMGYTVKVIYYGLMCIAFWTSFTGFFVPYYALGTEYCEDYDERTVIRSYASFFNTIGTLISMALPSAFVDALQDRGISLSRSWTIMVAISAVIAGASILVTFFASKEKDSDICEKTPTMGIRNMFMDFLDVIKMKPVRIVVVACLFTLIAYSFFISDLMYYLTYNMRFSGGSISKTLLFRCLLGLCLIPVGVWMCRKTDNRSALIIFFSLGIGGLILIRIFGGGGIITLALLIVASCSCTTYYWQIMPVLVYELCIYDEYVTGKKREGVMVSLQGLIETVASGIGLQLLGIVLQFAGFDGEADSQTPHVMEWILNCTTVIPVIFMVLAVVTLIGYPISRKKFQMMREEIGRRRNS